MSENLSLLSGKKKKYLFELITEKANSDGSLDSSEIKNLAKEYLMGDANIYGTISFYDFLHTDHSSKKIFTCNGTACLLAGTQSTLQDKLKRHFKNDEIGEMCCLGRCYENSAFHYNGKNYSGNDANELIEILEGEKVSVNSSIHTGSSMDEPVLINQTNDFENYSDKLQAILKKDPEELLKELHRSKLRGRGGAGFPIALKVAACKAAHEKQKFVVCNADEGDPGSFSDRFLLEEKPLSVLLGMLLTGYIIGADKGIIYLRAEYPESVEILQNAIKELEKSGFTGKNINNNGFDFHFKLIKGAGSYICGEETALLSSIEGQRPEVRIRPPFPTEQGLFNKPTIVSNVETLANVFYILSKGGDAFAKIGTDKSTGSKLICLDNHFHQAGLYEVEMGTPLKTIIDDLGGGFKNPVKALHIGGPLGGLVPTIMTDQLTLDFECFSKHGFELGHASFISIPEEYPMIKYLEHLFEFTAVESCGKCFPCRLGSVRGKELLENAGNRNGKINNILFDDLLETLEQGSLCGLGKGLPIPVRNAMTHFSEELKDFFE